MRHHRNLATVYYALALLGLGATWYYNVLYLLNGGSLAPGVFFEAAFANALTTAITLDMYLTGLVFSVWVLSDAGRIHLRWPWLYVVLCFGVGLAIALPLYLARREGALSRGAGV